MVLVKPLVRGHQSGELENKVKLLKQRNEEPWRSAIRRWPSNSAAWRAPAGRV
jgi:hypothetical protein